MAAETNTRDLFDLQFTGEANEVQQIVFTINGEEYGINVLNVQEIIRYVEPVKVPNTPEPVKGVINFRGEVIPVLDAREIFGLGTFSYNEFTVIVIVETNEKIFGLTVDRVSDMVSIPVLKVQEVPEFNARVKTKYLKAFGKIKERLILMLDLDKLIEFDQENLALQLEAEVN